jgi:CheY-like chemotaxis protein
MLENRVALVVEDDAHCLMVISKALKELGVRFKRNTTGANVLEQIHSMCPRPDCILLSLDLPEEDAYTIAQRIRTDPIMSEIPLIAVGDLSNTSKLQASGFDGLVSKPISRSQLGHLLRSIISGEQAWAVPV